MTDVNLIIEYEMCFLFSFQAVDMSLHYAPVKLLVFANICVINEEKLKLLIQSFLYTILLNRKLIPK